MKKMTRGIDRGYVQEIVEEESSGAKKNREGYSFSGKFHYHISLNEYFWKMQDFLIITEYDVWLSNIKLT